MKKSIALPASVLAAAHAAEIDTDLALAQTSLAGDMEYRRSQKDFTGGMTPKFYNSSFFGGCAGEFG